MKYLLYLLSLSIPLFYSIMLEECNKCNEWIKPQTNMYNVSYRLCVYDTSFDVTYTKQPKEQLDWLFLGTACDDRCPTTQAGEGYVCSLTDQGYREIEEDMSFGELFSKYEFHHFNCTVTDDLIFLHVHRLIPNKWLEKNVSIPYFISHGDNNEKNIKQNAQSFSIDYSNVSFVN